MSTNSLFAFWRELQVEDEAWGEAVRAFPEARYSSSFLDRKACHRDAKEGKELAVALYERYTAELVAAKLRG